MANVIMKSFLFPFIIFGIYWTNGTTFDCTGLRACRGQCLLCAQFEDCTVTCNGMLACQNSQIDGSLSNSLTVNGGEGYLAFAGSQIWCPESGKKSDCTITDSYGSPLDTTSFSNVIIYAHFGFDSFSLDCGGNQCFKPGEAIIQCDNGDHCQFKNTNFDWNEWECKAGSSIFCPISPIITPFPAYSTCATCPNIEKRSFTWEKLTKLGENIPNINVSRFEVIAADLSLIIEVELDYLGSVFGDEEKEPNFGVTYVLDFEDFDAHKHKINEPGTCENRDANAFVGITDFNDFWRYSFDPQDGNVGVLPYLAYPPVDSELWSINMKDKMCDTVVYTGTFSWKELRQCTAFPGAPGDSKEYTKISSNAEWLNLTGTFYVNVVSPFWYGSTDMNYYRVYQLLSQPFVIAIRSTVYVLGSTGINLNTIGIIAVYKENEETDFKLVVMTETAEYMMLTRDASSTIVFVPDEENKNNFLVTSFVASTTPENANCLTNKNYLCTQLWEISASISDCQAGLNGVGTDFSGTYSLSFIPTCKDPLPTSHCMEWIAAHANIYGMGKTSIALSTSLAWKDEICDPEIFEISLAAQMDFYDTEFYTAEVPASFLYQVGEDRVFVAVTTTFPSDEYNVFSTKLINVWICTFEPIEPIPYVVPFVDDGTREGMSSMGCWNSNRDSQYDADFYHIFSTTTNITNMHGFQPETAAPAANNIIRFSFIVPHEVARDTLFVHVQVEVTLQELELPRRRMLLTSGTHTGTANKMTHLGDEIGINHVEKPVENPPPPQEPNYNPNHYNYNPPVEAVPSAYMLSLSSPLVIGAAGLLALILACNVVFMCYVNCGRRGGRASFMKKLKRKGSGRYSAVKNCDSEDFNDSEAKAINVVSE